MPSPCSPDGPLDELVGYHLRRLSLLTMADLASALEPLGLRPTDASILLLIEANPRVTQSALGRMLGIQRANMTPLVAALEERGLLSRERMDGRSHALGLTAAGQALAADTLAAARESDRRCLASLDAAERRRLAGRLRELWTELGDAARNGPAR